MERGSVIDAQQTQMEWNPDSMLAVMDNGMVMQYWDYVHTHEYQKLNRSIQNALKMITKPRPRFYLLSLHR